MIMVIMFHELKQNLKSLIIWSVIVSACLITVMLLYPEVSEQLKPISGAYAKMGGLSSAFGLDRVDMTTPIGFFAIEAGTTFVLCGSMFAAIVGMQMLAKEEGGMTAEFLLTMPVGRMRIILEKLLAAVIILVVFNIVSYLSSIASFAMLGENIDAKTLAVYHLSQLIMQLEILFICFGLSAFLKKSSAGAAIGLALLLYFINILANLTDSLKFLKYFTPFNYSDSAMVIADGKFDLVLALIGITTGAAFLLLGIVKYAKKDIAI